MFTSSGERFVPLSVKFSVTAARVPAGDDRLVVAADHSQGRVGMAQDAVGHGTAQGAEVAGPAEGLLVAGLETYGQCLVRAHAGSVETTGSVVGRTTEATTAVPVLPERLLRVLTSRGERFTPLLVRLRVTRARVPPVMTVWLLPAATERPGRMAQYAVGDDLADGAQGVGAAEGLLVTRRRLAVRVLPPLTVMLSRPLAR